MLFIVKALICQTHYIEGTVEQKKNMFFSVCLPGTAGMYAACTGAAGRFCKDRRAEEDHEQYFSCGG